MSKLQPLLETIFLNRGGSPDLWRACAKVINSKPEEAKYFASYIQKKVTDLNQEVQLLALDVLDFLMDQGKIPVWTQIAAKNFLVQLINIVKTRDAPEVQAMILYLIKKWGLKFESYKEILPNFSEFYKALKNSNVTFPDEIQGGYQKYIGQEMPSENYENIQNIEKIENIENDNFEQTHQVQNESYDLNPNNYDKKYHKVLDKLSVWVENIILANDIIDNTEVGSQVDDGLIPVVDNLRSAENELVIYIQEKVKNEKLLGIMLSINDDINKTITRYDTIRARRKPEKFVSNGIRQKMEVIPKNKNNNFDLFSPNIADPPTNNKNNNNNNKNKSQADLFDIFNTSPVQVNNQVSSNIQNNNTNDIFNFVPQNQFSMNNNNNDKPNIAENLNMNMNTNTNMNMNPNINFNPNVQPNSQTKVESLADKLKNAYGGGKEETGDRMNNMNMMNMMGGPQIQQIPQMPQMPQMQQSGLPTNNMMPQISYGMQNNYNPMQRNSNVPQNLNFQTGFQNNPMTNPNPMYNLNSNFGPNNPYIMPNQNSNVNANFNPNPYLYGNSVNMPGNLPQGNFDPNTVVRNQQKFN